MKTCKICSISKPTAEFYKTSNRVGFRTVCKVCFTSKSLQRLRDNPPSKEQKKEAQKAFRERNPGYINQFRNPEKNRQYSSQWRQRHPELNRVKKAKERAIKLQAMPSWLSKEQLQQIKDIYKACPKGFHVDHIIPLNGKDVKGLHVPWNLQHLPAVDNMRKSNKIVGY